MEAYGSPNLKNEAFRDFGNPRLHLKQDQSRGGGGLRAASALNLADLLRSVI